MKNTAKVILICLGTLLCISLFGCATCKTHCPSENVVFEVDTPFGPMGIEMEKGTLDEENRGDQWMSREEFDKALEEESNEPEKKDI